MAVVGRIDFPEVRDGSESILGPRAFKEYRFGAWFMAGRLPVGQAGRRADEQAGGRQMGRRAGGRRRSKTELRSWLVARSCLSHMIINPYICNMKYESISKTSRVGERGQVTIPKAFRTRYGIKAGQDVLFEEHDDGMLIRKVPREDDPLRALLGRVRRKMDVDRYLDQTRGPGWTADLDQR